MEKNIEVQDILNMKAEAIVLLHDLADVAREAAMHSVRIHQIYQNAFGKFDYTYSRYDYSFYGW